MNQCLFCNTHGSIWSSNVIGSSVLISDPRILCIFLVSSVDVDWIEVSLSVFAVCAPDYIEIIPGLSILK